MGSTISHLLSLFVSKEDMRILMVGLDAAGKTTILYQLKLGEVINTIPTIGFHVETVDYKNVRFTVWDVGGQQRIRNLWHHYFTNSAAIIFVVDSSDVNRIEEAAEELHGMLERTELKNTVVVIFANKQDLPNALPLTELSRRLRVDKIKQNWHIHSTCATRGRGLWNGMEIVRQMIMKQKEMKK